MGDVVGEDLRVPHHSCHRRDIDKARPNPGATPVTAATRPAGLPIGWNSVVLNSLPDGMTTEPSHSIPMRSEFALGLGELLIGKSGGPNQTGWMKFVRQPDLPKTQTEILTWIS